MHYTLKEMKQKIEAHMVIKVCSRRFSLPSHEHTLQPAHTHTLSMRVQVRNRVTSSRVDFRVHSTYTPLPSHKEQEGKAQECLNKLLPKCI